MENGDIKNGMGTNGDNNTESPPPAGFRRLVRSLESRNYRLFFAGQGISLIGTWITRIATSWLIYRLTGSAVLLGVVGFAGQIPVLILSPFAGVWVDRWDRHRILVITQVLSAIQSFVLAALALPGIIQVWHVIALQVFQGMINSFDTPTRQAFVVEMVEHKDDLGNAIALNSSMVNGARLVGPSVAGLLIALTKDEGWCFLLDGISYIAVIASLLAMRFVAKPAHKSRHANVITDLKAGLSYAWSYKPIRATLLLLSTVSLMGMPYSVLLPVFATEVLHGTSSTYGFLSSTSGIGALVGAIYLASRTSVVGLGKVIPRATAIFGIGLIMFGLSKWLYGSLATLVVIGFGFMVQMAASNTVLQTVVDEEKRGRVMSLYTIAFLGIAPFGSLLAGFAAERIGAPRTVVISGVSCMIGALFYARQLPELREIVRPLYVSMGLLSDDEPPVSVEAMDAGEASTR